MVLPECFRENEDSCAVVTLIILTHTDSKLINMTRKIRKHRRHIWILMGKRHS